MTLYASLSVLAFGTEKLWIDLSTTHFCVKHACAWIENFFAFFAFLHSWGLRPQTLHNVGLRPPPKGPNVELGVALKGPQGPKCRTRRALKGPQGPKVSLGKNKKPNPQWQADIDWPVVHDLPPKIALPRRQGFSCFDQFAL